MPAAAAWKCIQQRSGLAAAIAFGTSSVALTLFNKAVLSSFAFPGTHTLTIAQAVVAIGCLHLMKRWKLTDFPTWDAGLAWKLLPLSLMYLAKIVTSMISLGRTNVPMFTALRQLSLVFVMVEEFMMLGVVPSKRVLQAVAVICIGATMAAAKDLSFEVGAYVYVFLANLFSSLYAVFIAVSKKRAPQLDVFGMLYYNYLALLPGVTIIAIVSGDLEASLAYPQLTEFAFAFTFSSSVVFAFALNVSAFYCTVLNSARTKTVTGGLKSFFTVCFGLMMFGDYRYDPFNFAGLVVSFLGGVYYSIVSHEETTSTSSSATAKSGNGNDAASAASAGTAPGKGALADGSADDAAASSSCCLSLQGDGDARNSGNGGASAGSSGNSSGGVGSSSSIGGGGVVGMQRAVKDKTTGGTPPASPPRHCPDVLVSAFTGGSGGGGGGGLGSGGSALATGVGGSGSGSSGGVLLHRGSHSARRDGGEGSVMMTTTSGGVSGGIELGHTAIGVVGGGGGGAYGHHHHHLALRAPPSGSSASVVMAPTAAQEAAAAAAASTSTFTPNVFSPVSAAGATGLASASVASGSSGSDVGGVGGFTSATATGAEHHPAATSLHVYNRKGGAGAVPLPPDASGVAVGGLAPASSSALR